MPETTMARVGALVVRPANEEVPRGHAVAAAAVRILARLMWLYNVSRKRAPDFGEKAGDRLYRFTSYA